MSSDPHARGSSRFRPLDGNAAGGGDWSPSTSAAPSERVQASGPGTAALDGWYTASPTRSTPSAAPKWDANTSNSSWMAQAPNSAPQQAGSWDNTPPKPSASSQPVQGSWGSPSPPQCDTSGQTSSFGAPSAQSTGQGQAPPAQSRQSSGPGWGAEPPRGPPAPTASNHTGSWGSSQPASTPANSPWQNNASQRSASQSTTGAWNVGTEAPTSFTASSGPVWDRPARKEPPLSQASGGWAAAPSVPQSSAPPQQQSGSDWTQRPAPAANLAPGPSVSASGPANGWPSAPAKPAQSSSTNMASWGSAEPAKPAVSQQTSNSWGASPGQPPVKEDPTSSTPSAGGGWPSTPAKPVETPKSAASWGNEAPARPPAATQAPNSSEDARPPSSSALAPPSGTGGWPSMPQNSPKPALTGNVGPGWSSAPQSESKPPPTTSAGPGWNVGNQGASKPPQATGPGWGTAPAPQIESTAPASATQGPGWSSTQQIASNERITQSNSGGWSSSAPAPQQNNAVSSAPPLNDPPAPSRAAQPSSDSWGPLPAKGSEPEKEHATRPPAPKVDHWGAPPAVKPSVPVEASKLMAPAQPIAVATSTGGWSSAATAGVKAEQGPLQSTPSHTSLASDKTEEVASSLATPPSNTTQVKTQGNETPSTASIIFPPHRRDTQTQLEQTPTKSSPTGSEGDWFDTKDGKTVRVDSPVKVEGGHSARESLDAHASEFLPRSVALQQSKGKAKALPPSITPFSDEASSDLLETSFASDVASVSSMTRADVATYKEAPLVSGALRADYADFYPSAAYFGKTDRDQSVILNTRAHASAVVLGNPATGKTYTLIAALENYLMKDARLGVLGEPAAALAFHIGHSGAGTSQQPCPLAHVSDLSPSAKRMGEAPHVTVLCSPTALPQMMRLYSGLRHVIVKPLAFASQKMNASRLVELVSEGLGVEVRSDLINVIAPLGDLVGYGSFLQAIEARGTSFSNGQRVVIKQRLDLLDRFFGSIDEETLTSSLKPGQLVIIDLSDDFLPAAFKVSLFEVSLGILLGSRLKSKLVVLDDAERVITAGRGQAAINFLGALHTAMRSGRHFGARVFISATDPLVLPSEIIETAELVALHKLNRPTVIDSLSGQLVSNSTRWRTEVTKLGRGQAIVFSPNSVGFNPRVSAAEDEEHEVKLGSNTLKVVVRICLTGGDSFSGC